MPSCADCIHYEVCKYLDGSITYIVTSATGDVVKKIEAITCGKFVNREAVFESPNLPLTREEEIRKEAREEFLAELREMTFEEIASLFGEGQSDD